MCVCVGEGGASGKRIEVLYIVLLSLVLLQFRGALLEETSRKGLPLSDVRYVISLRFDMLLFPSVLDCFL